MQYPKRTSSHRLEESSRRFFQNSLPENWASDKPNNDYGVDLRVDIFEGEDAKGLELLVQLKSSVNRSPGDTETIRLKTSTYNLLWDKLQVVMLVKYVEEEKEAYWILLSEVPEPNESHESFTVKIPRNNRLSTIDWERILTYVGEVTAGKIATRRRNRYQGGRIPATREPRTAKTGR